jgi:hypothetical protein
MEIEIEHEGSCLGGGIGVAAAAVILFYLWRPNVRGAFA